jgi:aspartyl-tRNA(Asn)/glutamyl-tRNA(Gln) amidotransferase subunit A
LHEIVQDFKVSRGSQIIPRTAFMSVTQLAKMIRRGSVTSVVLTEFYLDRLRRHGPNLRAVSTLTENLALRQARDMDRDLAAGHDRGLLHGIPYVIKDSLDPGEAPADASGTLRASPGSGDKATIVQRLKEAGAVLIAKTASVELEGAGLYGNASPMMLAGPSLNPWNSNPKYGGTTGSEAACVAAGLAGFGISTETWGNIMNSCAYCGLAGLRPTYGRVSRAGTLPLTWTADKIGPVARRTEDLIPILAAIAGPDPRDSSAIPRPFHLPSRAQPDTETPLRGFRLAYFPPSRMRRDDPLKLPLEDALGKLKALGASLVASTLPDYPYRAALDLIVNAESASAFWPLIASSAFLNIRNNTQKVGLYAAAQVTAVDYLRACRIRTLAQEAMAEYLRDYDALVNGVDFQIATRHKRGVQRNAPQHSLPHLGSARPNWENDAAANLLGLPGITVSMGFGSSGQLPLGLELFGKPLEEIRLVQIATAYENSTAWHHRHPQDYA